MPDLALMGPRSGHHQFGRYHRRTWEPASAVTTGSPACFLQANCCGPAPTTRARGSPSLGALGLWVWRGAVTSQPGAGVRRRLAPGRARALSSFAIHRGRNLGAQTILPVCQYHTNGCKRPRMMNKFEPNTYTPASITMSQCGLCASGSAFWGQARAPKELWECVAGRQIQLGPEFRWGRAREWRRRRSCYTYLRPPASGGARTRRID